MRDRDRNRDQNRGTELESQLRVRESVKSWRVRVSQESDSQSRDGRSERNAESERHAQTGRGWESATLK